MVGALFGVALHRSQICYPVRSASAAIIARTPSDRSRSSFLEIKIIGDHVAGPFLSPE
jgi:hypothetical protein